MVGDDKNVSRRKIDYYKNRLAEPGLLRPAAVHDVEASGGVRSRAISREALSCEILKAIVGKQKPALYGNDFSLATLRFAEEVTRTYGSTSVLFS